MMLVCADQCFSMIDQEPHVRSGPSSRARGRLHAGTFTGPTGMFQQVTGLTKPQTDLLAKLGIPHPKQVINLQPMTS